MKTNKYEIDMCNGSIMDKLISFSLPLMLTSILQLMFNAVDIIVVGAFLTAARHWRRWGSTTALINIFTNLFYRYFPGGQCAGGPVLCGGASPGNVGSGTYGHCPGADQRDSDGFCGAGRFPGGPGADGYAGGCDRSVHPLYADLFHGNAFLHAL